MGTEMFVDGDIRFRDSVNGTGTVIASGSIIFDNVTLGHPVVLDPATRLSFSAGADDGPVGRQSQRQAGDDGIQMDGGGRKALLPRRVHRPHRDLVDPSLTGTSAVNTSPATVAGNSLTVTPARMPSSVTVPVTRRSGVLTNAPSAGEVIATSWIDPPNDR